FRGCGPKMDKSAFSSRMREYLQSGWIDTNHAYGDFDGSGGFTREHAVACYEELGRLGVQLRVFTNHGSAANIQNVGKDADYHQGDNPRSAAYHADLMRANGIEYLWTDSLVVARPRRFSYLSRWPKKSSLLSESELQDGTRWKSFMRFRSTGINAPNLSSVGHQLNQINLEYFYD